MGQYLSKLKGRFRGPIVADLLCYLRVYTELALRAKGMLLMRESGFDLPMDEATQAKFAELRYLETSIGRTGLRALEARCGTSATRSCGSSTCCRSDLQRKFIVTVAANH